MIIQTINLSPYTMKHLLFILFFLPLVSIGQTFDYSRVTVSTVGADYFRFDHEDCQEVRGSINLNKKEIIINGERHTIRKRRKDKVLKTNKGLIKLVYSGKELRTVHVLRYNTRYTYYILNHPVFANR